MFPMWFDKVIVFFVTRDFYVKRKILGLSFLFSDFYNC